MVVQEHKSVVVHFYSMCSMCGEFLFHNLGGYIATSVTKHDSFRLPPGAACYKVKLPHYKTQSSVSGWQSQSSHFPRRPNYYFIVQGLSLRVSLLGNAPAIGPNLDHA